MARFFNELEFVKFLEDAPGMSRRAMADGVHKEGASALRAVKDVIGRYQREDLHGLEAWRELAPMTKRERVAQGFTENDPGLRTGEMRDAYKVVDKPPGGFVLGNPLEKAAKFENGDPGRRQPPRPVIKLALARMLKPGTRRVATRMASVMAGGNGRNV